jgi:hypothetical protein
MKTTLVVLLLAVAGCAEESGWSPQLTDLYAIRGDTVECVNTVEQAWADTTGFCEWTCVFDGDTKHGRARVSFGRAGESWVVTGTAYSGIDASLCP